MISLKSKYNHSLAPIIKRSKTELDLPIKDWKCAYELFAVNCIATADDPCHGGIRKLRT